MEKEILNLIGTIPGLIKVKYNKINKQPADDYTCFLGTTKRSNLEKYSYLVDILICTVIA